MEPIYDCLVIGAGPAGLTAAIYLARFDLRLCVIDAGNSRCATIPCTRNHAGYPEGIAGIALLALMREQAAVFGIEVTDGVVEKIAKRGEQFVARVEEGELIARTVLLATGVVNNRPKISPEVHDLALSRGLLRYCPICDGYEVRDKCVAVIGTGARGHNEALFLRMYTKDLTLIAPDNAHSLTAEESASLTELGIRLVEGPYQPLRIDHEQIIVPTQAGDLAFDSLYPALGSVIRSELARPLGAEMSEEGCLVIDDHQRTSVSGIYAAGDVSKGLDQISHAMGEAGVAATAIRNDLARAGGLWR